MILRGERSGLQTHCGDGKRFVVRPDEKLNCVVELESAIRVCGESPRQTGEISRIFPGMKTSIPPVLITFALVCFSLFPKAHGVVPPPDGGYPGFSTAEGTNALQSLTTGSANTAVGWYSLFSDAAGSFNTATGAGALLFNTVDANTAFGAAALLFNTTGEQNTAVGEAALLNNTTGPSNTATGYQALFNNTTGNSNTANGASALLSNTTGIFNTASGEEALFSNTTGGENTAVGFQALYHTTVGVVNTAVGSGALSSNITGEANVAIGYQALSHQTGGSGNIVLGANAGKFVTGASSVIVIGAPGANVSGSCFIGNIFGVTPVGQATPVVIDSNGQLGTSSSSVRFKNDITMMGNASEAILSLKPVTFHYKSDQTTTPQFGLIAEDVAKINPDLVIRDAKGELYTVRYDAVNAMLLNEFLKEHKTVQEQGAMIARQQKAIEALTAGLQKVSGQLEANKITQQVVLNPKSGQR